MWWRNCRDEDVKNKCLFMKLNAAVVICCGLALFAACKKTDNDSPTANKLKAGRWQITGSAITVKYNGKDTTIDDYSQWRACEQDDYVEFGDEGKGTANENTNKCAEDNQVNRSEERRVGKECRSRWS